VRRQRGVSFIIALAAMALVVTVVAVYAQNQTVAFKAVTARNETRRAEAAAMAGVQRALAELQAVVDAAGEPVTLEDDWAVLGTNGAEEFTLGTDSFRIQIIDNASKIDLNTITEDHLTNLNLTQEQIDSFLDWRNVGESNRAEGAKDDYYNGLFKPYNAHENQLQSVYELLDIKGFTPLNVFYPVDNTSSTGTSSAVSDIALVELVTTQNFSAATTPEGDGRVNVNNPQLNAQNFSQQAQIPLQTAQQIIAQRATQPNATFTALSQVLNVPGIANNQAVVRSVLDRMTVSPGEQLSGKINVNTAPEAVLQTIPGITEDIATQIVDSRPTGGYTQLSELLSIGSDQAFAGAVADKFNVNSQCFQIRVLGKSGRTEYGIEALIQIDQGVLKVIRIERPPYADLAAQWLWDEATTQTPLLDN
jgi:general secretion pathway protein K